jgi:hypothetical protein
MKLALTRAGGVAGLRRPPLELDTRDLAPPARQRMEELVDAAPLAAPPAGREAASPDELGYELTVTHDDGRVDTVEFSHATASPELRALVAELRAVTRAT